MTKTSPDLANAMRFSVAPMMEWTDRHCRFFHRLLSRRARLYTEMITTGAVLHGDREVGAGRVVDERVHLLRGLGCGIAALAPGAHREYAADEVPAGVLLVLGGYRGGQRNHAPST